MRSLNTWNVGGCCDFFTSPRSVNEAQEAIRFAAGNGSRLYVLGGGSNILVQDGLLAGIVMHTACLNGIDISALSDERIVLKVEAGFPVIRLLGLAIKNRWGGLEFLTGIPGSIGGALWGNTGADGHGFAPHVESIDVIDSHGKLNTLTATDLCWNYRQCPCTGMDAIFITSCTLVLKKNSEEMIFKRIRHFAELKKGQPLGKKTAGCVFKNPADGISAGRLLDKAGCKGLRVGEAAVSESHANFIENQGNATALDIFSLGELCRELVYLRCGVRLEYEIHFFGDFEKD